jgi:hypothetical protein
MKNNRSYDQWTRDVSGFTVAEIRFDSPPPDALMELLDFYGLERWETYSATYCDSVN